MDLTRQNFDTVFPKFLQLLRTCDFYSFDLEMTGINCVEDKITSVPTSDPSQIKFLKKPSELFASKWAAAATFSPMQIGVALFHRVTPMEHISHSRPSFAHDIALAIFDGYVQSNDAKWAKEQIEQQTQALKLTFPPAALSTATAESPSLTLDELSLIADRYSLLTELERLTELIARVEKEIKAPDMQSYRATTFSAHLFPSHFFGDGVLQMSIETTGTFLSEHHMDFNAWVRSSLFFGPRETIAEARLQRLRGTADTKSTQDEDNEALASITVPADKSKLKMLFMLLEQWAKDNESNPTATLNGAIPFLPDMLHNLLQRKAKSLNLKIMKGTVSFGSPSGSAASAGGNDILKSVTHQGTLLMEALVASKKPVVVHNSWSDLVFFYRALHAKPLESYAAFKAAMKSLFPILFDTRTLTTLPCMESVGRVRGRLDATFSLFQKLPTSNRIRIEPITLAGTPAVASGAAAHDAGFDAFQTGSLYLYALSYAKSRGESPETFGKLQGVIPVYACVFSINLLNPQQDLLIHPHHMPILVGIPEKQGPIFASVLEKIVQSVGITAVVMNAGDSAVVYVTETSSPQALQRLQHEFTNKFGTVAKLVDLKISDFIGKNSDIAFF